MTTTQSLYTVTVVVTQQFSLMDTAAHAYVETVCLILLSIYLYLLLINLK